MPPALTRCPPQVELQELPPESCLGEIGFKVGSACSNSLYLTNAVKSQQRKTEEDDLSLGASASPTLIFVNNAAPDRKRRYNGVLWLDESGQEVTFDHCADSASKTKPDTGKPFGRAPSNDPCSLLGSFHKPPQLVSFYALLEH